MSDEIPRTDAGKAREGLVDELNTITEYEDMADESSDPELKEQFEEVIDDERVHCGNFAHLLERADPKAAPKMREGYDESERMSKALPPFEEMMGFAKVGTSMPNREHWNDQRANRSRARNEGMSQLRGSPTFPDRKWRGGAVPLVTNDATVQTSWPDQNAAIRAGRADYATSAHLPRHPYRLGIAPTSSDEHFDYWEGADEEHPTLVFSRPKDGGHLGYIYPGQDGPITYSVWGEGEDEIVRGPEGHQMMIYYDDPNDYSKGGRFAAITPSSDEWDLDPYLRTIRHPPKRNMKSGSTKTKTKTKKKKNDGSHLKKPLSEKQLDQRMRRFNMNMNKSSITKDLMSDRVNLDQVLEGKAAAAATDMIRTLFGAGGQKKRMIPIDEYIDTHPDVFGDVDPQAKGALFNAIALNLNKELANNKLTTGQANAVMEQFMGNAPSNVGGNKDAARRAQLEAQQHAAYADRKEQRRAIDADRKAEIEYHNRAGNHNINPAYINKKVGAILGPKRSKRLAEMLPRLQEGVDPTPEQLQAIKDVEGLRDTYINAAKDHMSIDEANEAANVLGGMFIPNVGKKIYTPPVEEFNGKKRFKTGFGAAERMMNKIYQKVYEDVMNTPSSFDIGSAKIDQNEVRDHNKDLADIKQRNTEGHVKMPQGTRRSPEVFDLGRSVGTQSSGGRYNSDEKRQFTSGPNNTLIPKDGKTEKSSFSEMLKSANEAKWKEKGLPAGTCDKTLPAYYRYVDMSINDPINMYEHEKMGKDQGVSVRQMSFNHIR